MTAPAEPSAPDTPLLNGPAVVELVVLLLVALGVRLAAGWALGGGAPFGPDGTGAEAAVHLGGHLYPLHIVLIRVAGSAKLVSLVAGTLTCGLLWHYGRSLKLSGAGGWLAAFLPLTVYSSVLSAGDAPALFVVVLGAVVALRSEVWSVAGGALAMVSVVVKPVALPALALFAVRLQGLIGMVLVLPFVWGWLEPLVSPRPGSGLLGSWWQANGGVPPETPRVGGSMLKMAAKTLVTVPAWVGVWLIPVAALGAFLPAQGKRPDPPPSVRLAGMLVLLAPLAVAYMFGSRLSGRYMEGAVLALLPWAGLALPRGFEALLLVPTAALITQVGAYRAVEDPLSGVPEYPTLVFPDVDARALFDEASTRDATGMRAEAEALARTLPQGARHAVRRLPHGREGELVWPLKVLRPDVVIVYED